MDTEVLSQEQRVLRQVSKTLGNIVKDITPLAGNANPLSNSTMQDIRDCYSLISEREKELSGKSGLDEATSQHTGSEQPGSSTLSFVKLPRIKK